MVMAPPQELTAVVVDIQSPPAACAVDPRRMERAVLTPVPAMKPLSETGDPEQMARLLKETGRNDERSSDSSQPSTSSSSEENEEHSGAYRFSSFARSASRNFLAKIRSNLLPGSTSEENRPWVDDRLDHLKYERVDQFPEGYPQLAAFVNSDDSFANFRRFGRLSARILLHLQIELTDLETRLDALDKDDAADPTMKRRLHGFDFKQNDTKQRDLLAEAGAKYAQYADIALKDASLRELGQAPERNHIASFNWIWNERPLGDGKFDFILHADDFVSLAKHSQKERRVQNSIERWLDKHPVSFFKWFLQTEKQINKTNDPRVDHYSATRLEVLANILSVSVGAIILLIPAFLLFLVPMSRGWMAVTASSFVILFSVVVSAVTGAKIHEVFFGTAAYSAVLFIFLGNVNEGGYAGPK